MVGRQADVRAAIEGADLITHDADRADRESHYQVTGPGRLMLKVVVEYRIVAGRSTGSVVTAYPLGRVKPEEAPRWP